MFICLQFVFSLFSLLLYGFFRGGIYAHLRLRKVSKTAIKRNQKGFRNFWFYQDIQKNYGLGKAHVLNMAYIWVTVLHLSILSLTLVFSWMKLPLFVCSCLLCLLQIPAVIYGSVNENRADFGSGFVLLARVKETKKYRSSFVDLFSWCATAFVVYLSYGCI